MSRAVRRPVLSQSYPNYMPPMAPVLDTAPAKKKPKLVPMVINEGTSMAYTVMYDPENNKVVPDNSALSNMMTRNIDAEQETLKATNEQYRKNTVVDPYQEAEQRMKVANDKFNLAQQYELGASPYLEEYTQAKQDADNILANDIQPDAIDGVLNATNTYKQAPHALEALEAQNPYEQQEKKAFSEAEAILNAPNTDTPILQNDQYDPVDDMVAGENQFTYEPVLTDNTKPKPKGNGILNTTTTASQDRMSSPVTANARGSAMPYGKVGRNEMLMRMGAKMMAGSTQGYGAAMGAAFSEYGNIQDANRQAETDAFNKEEATRLAEERIAALKAKGSNKTTDKDKETFNNVSSQLNSFQSGLDAIAQSKAEGGNLTGVGGIFKSFIDNYTGSPDAARRLLLSRLKVDDALLRVAETKGAISNKEMDLFLQPAPKNFQDEKIWVDWINERMVALRNVQNRLNGNVVINESEQSYRYRAPTSNYKPVEVDGFKIQQTKK